VTTRSRTPRPAPQWLYAARSAAGGIGASSLTLLACGAFAVGAGVSRAHVRGTTAAPVTSYVARPLPHPVASVSHITARPAPRAAEKARRPLHARHTVANAARPAPRTGTRPATREQPQAVAAPVSETPSPLRAAPELGDAAPPPSEHPAERVAQPQADVQLPALPAPTLPSLPAVPLPLPAPVPLPQTVESVLP